MPKCEYCRFWYSTDWVVGLCLHAPSSGIENDKLVLKRTAWTDTCEHCEKGGK
jgi:hypothetical protein